MDCLSEALMNKDNGDDDNGIDDEVETSERKEPILPYLDLTLTCMYINIIDPQLITTAMIIPGE